jgi:DNA-binding phage protein
MRRTYTELSFKAFDSAAARRYLAGIRALVTEALETRDPRVLLGVLEILARQGATVRDLFRGKV